MDAITAGPTATSTGAPSSRGATRLRTTAALVALLALVGALLPQPTEAQTTWTAADDATIRPGVQLLSASGQCTANFVFTQGDDVLLGSAAHCTGLGAATDTDGCQAGSLPLGSPIEIEGAEHPGELAYSSWETMNQNREADPATCAFNDFALIRLDSRDHDRVNPTIPHWGGPTALGDETASLERVYSYGNSSLRAGLALLKPKTGLSLGSSAEGWTHTVYTATPGIPGDSGSAFLDADGRAVGVLSTLALAPAALSNGVSDLARSLAYANAHDTGQTIQLARGTQAFQGERLPIGGTDLSTQSTPDDAPSAGVEIRYNILGHQGSLGF
ncbi:MAG: serine protease [Nitriliruptor sp.]